MLHFWPFMSLAIWSPEIVTHSASVLFCDYL